jgi:hypothetical protein
MLVTLFNVVDLWRVKFQFLPESLTHFEAFMSLGVEVVRWNPSLFSSLPLLASIVESLSRVNSLFAAQKATLKSSESGIFSHQVPLNDGN